MFLSLEYIIYLLIILAAFLLGIIFWRKNSDLKFLIILIGLTFVSECCSRFLASHITNSNPPYHFLAPAQSILWGLFFLHNANSKKWKYLFAITNTMVILFSIFNTIFIQNIYSFPDNVLRIQSFVFLSMGFILFFEEIDQPSEKNIFKEPIFLISIALIWFNLISFTFFNFHSFLLQNIFSSATFRLINYVSNYTYYLILLIAILLSSFKAKKNDLK